MRVQITIDCADPARLVTFWSAALGYVVGDCADSIVDPAGVGPRIRFQRVPERKTVKNRVHLDLKASGASAFVRQQALVEAEVARLVGLGATVIGRVPADTHDDYAVTLADPEGNELCVG